MTLKRVTVAILKVDLIKDTGKFFNNFKKHPGEPSRNGFIIRKRELSFQ